MPRIDMAELRAALGRYDHRDLAQALAEVDPVDALTVLFPVNGPHDPDRIADAALALSSLVRYLNYASTAEGSPDPGTLDQIIGHLGAAAGGLQQTVDQVAVRLGEFARDPRLASDGMAYRELTPAQTAQRAAVALREARELLGDLHATLTAAHDLIARLYLRDDEEARP